jgi:quercetin dioxygenase-like cupin family protein
VKRWHLPTLPESTEKQTEREPGADAPRVPSPGSPRPRVLFSTPECRAVVIDLRTGEEMGDHQVHERAVIEVVHGRVSIESARETAECGQGTLVTLDPGERHAVRCLEEARLLLVLAPWPAAGHAAEWDEEHVPANATVEPITNT